MENSQTTTSDSNSFEAVNNMLISSDRVEGTAVYNDAGDHLGTIRDLMINKVSGRAEYAVMTFGGFLGVGTDQYPIPWDKLDYSVDRGGYVIDVSKEQLNAAPKYDAEQEPEYNRDYATSIDAYYGFTR